MICMFGLASFVELSYFICFLNSSCFRCNFTFIHFKQINLLGFSGFKKKKKKIYNPIVGECGFESWMFPLEKSGGVN
jgi:hypothetical protein